jgi:hypothetical protein
VISRRVSDGIIIVIAKHYGSDKGQIMNLVQQLLDYKQTASRSAIEELVNFYEEVCSQ